MVSEERKLQLREAQRRRREKLASGERGQVNIFLTQQCKDLVDRWCLEYKTDRNNLINGLILAFAKDPKNIF
ncbi:MAG: hypothetical protein Q7U42_11525 [Parvibaculum sp.]|nr:hypothetical protein [Parvibaculum sp.]